MTIWQRIINFIQSLFGLADSAKTEAAAPAVPAAPAAPAASAGPAGPSSSAPSASPGVLTVRDYVASFAATRIGDTVVHPLTPPADAIGYGPGGRYDPAAFDPAVYDAQLERLAYPDGNYIDIRGLHRHWRSGDSEAVTPVQVRAWLYGLSIDPATPSIQGDLLARATVEAPRALWRNTPAPAHGSFGG